jgi:hypothetical protein
VFLCTGVPMEVAGALREPQWRGTSHVPVPQAPFPGVTLTLRRMTTVIKIDLESGEEGDTGSQEAS